MTKAHETLYWAVPIDALLTRLAASAQGLADGEVAARLRRIGPNSVGGEHRTSAPGLLLRQFASPLVLILLFGAGVSLVLRQWVDASIILAIVLGSALLSFVQEYRASHAVDALRQRLALTSRTLRDGAERSVASDALVPGDVVLLAAGNLVPADGVILEANDFLVTEAALTGESLPVEKAPGEVAADAPVSGRSNCVFMGSAVRSGTARVLIVETGCHTQFGAVAARLRRSEPETDFARGVRRFGMMLLNLMIVIVLGVLTVNQLLGRPIAESLLFAVALAVGLSPELLPAIVSVTLAAGARHLARGGVIVRRLEAIENLGSMDVLCTDKTGTLTLGAVSLAEAIDSTGQPSRRVREAGYVNAWFEAGIANPLDTALCAAAKSEGWTAAGLRKLGEIPYDFQRRRLSIIVGDATPQAATRIVTKGAVTDVLAVCAFVAQPDGEAHPLDGAARAALEELSRAQGEAGLRLLGVAERLLDAGARVTREDECAMTFLGFLAFVDPPKPDAAKAIAALEALGIVVKVISGDNRHVTAYVARAVGLDPAAMLTGAEVAKMSDRALAHRARATQLFVEIDPQQKERIVRALQGAGHSVGFLGDGINDAPALHVADVGISVDQAVDVARASADIVLLRRDLDVLRQGVEDGRRTFANTLKYIAITTSANFGNMVSMALMTPLLPFLPLLPKQILLNNFLSDLPSIAISTDRVDPEHVARPQRWDVREVRRFMIVFGLVSSCFDGMTFALLLLVFHADAPLFQTAWFLVSLLTELVVLLVMRTRRPALRSRPSRLLLWSTVAVTGVALLLPWVPGLAPLFGLVALTPAMLAASLGIVLGYAVATELAKQLYYRRQTRPTRRVALRT
ncbi:magnesium-translocating P-type ATPase [Sphingomonas canadensis]|uniref:Magnesium-transporting ATPase, P-type 1 n=1 Tax=Sphingomonas canadensis TaxID=1219257 RepID=A0ABW3H7K2_9SPHN|nr:magnesium-translocating P-type ATPase [Sphingomonas canadensis]MCW3837291.1 magnesium-translocating P-type ATPase [Sphingomonas canadensis]